MGQSGIVMEDASNQRATYPPVPVEKRVDRFKSGVGQPLLDKRRIQVVFVADEVLQPGQAGFNMVSRR